MRRTDQRLSTGYFVTLHHDNVELTIRTDNGTNEELAAEAVEMRQKAARLIRNADMIRLAIHGY